MLLIIGRSLRDFLDIKILLISIVPITISALVWAIIFYVFSSQIDLALASLLSRIPLLNNDWVRSTVEIVGGLFIYYELLIITSVMIVGLIADTVVDRVNARHYQLDKKGFGSLTGSMVTSLKSNLLFIILFILSLPLLFVPVLNIGVQLLLWVILIKTPLFYDSIAMIATREEFRLLKGKRRMAKFMVALTAASLFLIPVVGVFVYVLQLLFFAHFNLQRLVQCRALDQVR